MRSALLSVRLWFSELLRKNANADSQRTRIRRRSRSIVLAVVSTLLVGLGSQANAVPATYIVTPTTLSTAGTNGCTAANSCAFKAYQGCNLTAQTVGTAIGTAVAGTALPAFTGDTATPPKVCFRAENPGGAGGFADIFTLNAVPPAPGTTTATMTCVFAAGAPPGNFACVAN